MALTATGVTSLPIPSPGITAMRALGPPLRRGMWGTFFGSDWDVNEVTLAQVGERYEIAAIS
jgi:hypothetical protein